MTKGFSKPGTNDIGVKRVYRMSGLNSTTDYYNYIIQSKYKSLKKKGRGGGGGGGGEMTRVIEIREVFYIYIYIY